VKSAANAEDGTGSGAIVVVIANANFILSILFALYAVLLSISDPTQYDHRRITDNDSTEPLDGRRNQQNRSRE
jgi:hypothetical protein